MPYKSTRKKKVTYRKRRAYKKRVFRPQRLIRSGFPRTTAIKLRYVEQIALDPSSGLTLASHSFSANNLFDPNAAVGGHQPMNFDMWALLYNHYVVIGSKIKATVMKQSTQNGTIICGINLADDTSFSASYITLLEQGLLSRKFITANNAVKPQMLVKTFSAKKFFNVTNVLDNVHRMGSIVAGSPQDQAYYNIWAVNSETDTNQLPIQILVELEYIAIFSEPKEQPQS